MSKVANKTGKKGKQTTSRKRKPRAQKPAANQQGTWSMTPEEALRVNYLENEPAE